MVDGSTPRFRGPLRNRRLYRPYQPLSDGDVITVGGIQVQAIAKPGHTPGTLSCLLTGSLLFTGDTIGLRDGLAHPYHRLFSVDPATQRDSLCKLASLHSSDWLSTAHTGCTSDFAAAMTNWRG